jgi:hypothetical protein
MNIDLRHEVGDLIDITGTSAQCELTNWYAKAHF